MFSFLADPTAYVALATLIVMEVVLGIDNLIFISILTNKLPKAQQKRARRIGISAALLLRLGLLSTIAIIVTLTEPVFAVMGHA
ncbi:MAG: TerC family protein, partial [Rhizobiaceae bacterium]